MSKHIRETFGIVDQKTKKPYSDLLSYSLKRDSVSQAFLFQKVIEVNGEVYILHMDSKLKRILKTLELGETTDIIISLQVRTNLRIALARSYVPKNNENNENNEETEGVE